MLLPTELLLSLRHVLSCMISSPLYVLSSHFSLLSVLLYLSLPPLYYLFFFTVPACPVLSFLLLLLSLSTSSSYCICSRPLSISCPVLPVPDYVRVLLYLFLDPVSVLSYSFCSRYLSMSFLVLPAAGPYLSCPTCSWSLSIGPVLLCPFIPLSVSCTVIHALVSSLCTY